VVADAKRRDSPLHSYFEWDNGKAAHAWRIEQARTLIRTVMVVVRTEKQSVSVVAYVRDPDQESGDQGYVSTLKLLDDKDLARSALVEEFSRAASVMRRARELAIAFALEGDVDSITRKIEVTRKRAETRPASRGN
jgi:sugar-specific transcriptional regulator TrmB